MKFAFKDSKLERLYTFGEGAEMLPVGVYRRFLTVMEFILNATDERFLYTIKGLHTEKLIGSRAGQLSVRLNGQFRLCFEIHKQENGNVIFLLEIMDYH